MSALDELIEIGAHRVVEHAPLGERTTYRVGGVARVLVTLSTWADLDELGPLIERCEQQVVTLGNGSNLLVADGEHDVVALHLDGEFNELAWHDADALVVVDAGAGLDLPVAARRLAAAGIVGFEWAVGVPGTFGGAAVMNAGGHGSDMAAVVRSVRTWRGGARSWTGEELGFGYRTSAISSDDVVTSVTLALTRGDAERANQTIREVVRWRREHQPGGANAGSVFQNPDGDFAGHLIDDAGCRGLRVGSARVSEKHANFIIADPGGSANDVYQLIGVVRDRVEQRSGVRLHSEHRFIGFGAP